MTNEQSDRVFEGLGRRILFGDTPEEIVRSLQEQEVPLDLAAGELIKNVDAAFSMMAGLLDVKSPELWHILCQARCAA